MAEVVRSELQHSFGEVPAPSGALLQQVVGAVRSMIPVTPQPITMPERVYDLERRQSEIEMGILIIGGFFLLMMILRSMR